ncbi:hypothetical protein KGO95_01550 [Patescibacteria group bacterium]|nr:hypothetical protein [Patescibacteria group bacterium]
MNKNAKIGIIDAIIMTLLCISADAAQIIADLSIAIPVVGEVLPLAAWAYGLAISGIVLFWLIMKGVSTKWFLGGAGIDLIPFVNILPGTTAAIIATIIEDNLPEKTKAVTSLVSKAVNPLEK